MERAGWAKAIGTALAVVLSAGLISCGPAADDEPNADLVPSPVETSIPEPRPEPVAEPIVIPACEELLPEEVLTEFASYGYVAVVGEDAEKLARIGGEALGPVAQESLAQARQDRRCSWGMPHSDLLVLVIVAELPVETRTHFVAELHASDYSGSSSGDIAIFTHQIPVAGTIWYGFEGDLWVTTLGSPEVGEQVFETLRAVNSG